MAISKESKKAVWEMMWEDRREAARQIASLSAEEIKALQQAMREWIAMLDKTENDLEFSERSAAIIDKADKVIRRVTDGSDRRALLALLGLAKELRDQRLPDLTPADRASAIYQNWEQNAKEAEAKIAELTLALESPQNSTERKATRASLRHWQQVLQRNTIQMAGK